MNKQPQQSYILVLGSLMVLVGMYLPFTLDFFWDSMIVDIRTAITTGDSGHLILTGAFWCFLTMLTGVLVFNGIILFVRFFHGGNHTFRDAAVILLIFTGVMLLYIRLLRGETEFLPIVLSGFMSMILMGYSAKAMSHYGRNLIITLQVFFAFQWLNVLPALTGYGFGLSDIPGSIKVSAIYLGSTSVFHFIGMAFFFVLLASSLGTYVLFRGSDRNIAMTKENFEKQMELDAMKAKAVENRMYEEINAVAHDLKTPLVTIQGLNSLIAMTDSTDKIAEYTDRVDGAVSKMTEMISAYLYETAKQLTSAQSVIDYVRAQTPLEDESLSINFHLEEVLPDVYINKIRVARAIINIIENAISVPTESDRKIININGYKIDGELVVEVSDNGMGIPQNQIEKIWEIGYSTRQTTGIGMFFVKSVIENNGGSIQINSILGKGTKVAIRLPIWTEEEM